MDCDLQDQPEEISACSKGGGKATTLFWREGLESQMDD